MLETHQTESTKDHESIVMPKVVFEEHEHHHHEKKHDHHHKHHHHKFDYEHDKNKKEKVRISGVDITKDKFIDALSLH